MLIFFFTRNAKQRNVKRRTERRKDISTERPKNRKTEKTDNSQQFIVQNIIFHYFEKNFGNNEIFYYSC